MAEPSASLPLPWLMEELIEEILLRLPPQEPASLVHATLVCKPWRHLISNPSFRRRFREFHRTPPMLGFLCNHHCNGSSMARTAVSSPLHSITRSGWRPLDARHGRVLLREAKQNALVVWDPITQVWEELPALPRRALSCSAAVLCAAGAGVCHHHDCHLGPFLVVFVGTDPWGMFVCTYDSADCFAAWSEPISIPHPNDSYIYSVGCSPAVLLGNQLYFGIRRTNTALQYDFELRKISWIQLPTLPRCDQRSVLTTTEDGLGLVSLSDSKLCMWLRMDSPEAIAGWTQFKTIDLGRWLHGASVVGFADGLNIVFVAANATLYTIDLKTYMVKKLHNCRRSICDVFPYMRFYNPALEAACLGDVEQ